MSSSTATAATGEEEDDDENNGGGGGGGGRKVPASRVGAGAAAKGRAGAALPPGFAAARAGDLEGLKKLVEGAGGDKWDPRVAVDRNGSSPLDWAAGEGRVEVCRWVGLRNVPTTVCIGRVCGVCVSKFLFFGDVGRGRPGVFRAVRKGWGSSGVVKVGFDIMDSDGSFEGGREWFVQQHRCLRRSAFIFSPRVLL